MANDAKPLTDDETFPPLFACTQCSWRSTLEASRLRVSRGIDNRVCPWCSFATVVDLNAEARGVVAARDATIDKLKAEREELRWQLVDRDSKVEALTVENAKLSAERDAANERLGKAMTAFPDVVDLATLLLRHGVGTSWFKHESEERQSKLLSEWLSEEIDYDALAQLEAPMTELIVGECGPCPELCVCRAPVTQLGRCKLCASGLHLVMESDLEAPRSGATEEER